MEYIRKNPEGVTITDISNWLRYSRNTVSKYILSLKLKEEIYSKRIGRYKLYFSTTKAFIPRKLVIDITKAMCGSIKDTVFKSADGISKNESLIKEIGKNIIKYFEFEYQSSFKESLIDLRDNYTPKQQLEKYAEYFNSFNFFEDNIKIEILKIEPNENKGFYRITESEFLGTNKNYIVYFFLICGFSEAIIKREGNQDTICKIEEIHIANRKKNSFVDISLQFL